MSTAFRDPLLYIRSKVDQHRQVIHTWDLLQNDIESGRHIAAISAMTFSVDRVYLAPLPLSHVRQSRDNPLNAFSRYPISHMIEVMKYCCWQGSACDVLLSMVYNCI